MANCPSTAKCPFLHDEMANIPPAAGALRRTYCQGTFERCARFVVKQAMGKDAVSADLLPADIGRARKVLQAAGHAVAS